MSTLQTNVTNLYFQEKTIMSSNCFFCLSFIVCVLAAAAQTSTFCSETTTAHRNSSNKVPRRPKEDGDDCGQCLYNDYLGQCHCEQLCNCIDQMTNCFSCNTPSSTNSCFNDPNIGSWAASCLSNFTCVSFVETPAFDMTCNSKRKAREVPCNVCGQDNDIFSCNGTNITYYSQCSSSDCTNCNSAITFSTGCQFVQSKNVWVFLDANPLIPNCQQADVQYWPSTECSQTSEQSEQGYQTFVGPQESCFRNPNLPQTTLRVQC